MRRFIIALVLYLAALAILIPGCAKKAADPDTFVPELLSQKDERSPSGKLEKRTTKARVHSGVMTATEEHRPITEKQLGIPIYPGAKQKGPFTKSHDSRGNDILSVMFTTRDKPEKIVDFYEKNLKGKTRTREQTIDGTRFVQIDRLSGPGKLSVSVETAKDGSTNIVMIHIK